MRKKQPSAATRIGPICIRCPESRFLDPGKEICYKTGGLYCRLLKAVVGKYEPCRLQKGQSKEA
ncbi:MAG: hypothetical protein ACE5DW_02580 [Thermodesulfobacteriota bacterium]